MGENNKVDLFLDSGAYSAMSQGAEIDIQEYIKFIKEHEHLLNVYVNLDVIGDKIKGPGIDSAEATLKNQKIMEEAGLNPMPVFHRGEPLEYLQHYVDNYDYIGLGMGRAIGNTDQLPLWLDTVFGNIICGGDGYPKVKVHGFGMTSLKLMLRYPWYSVDSTSWALTGGMGSIFVPRYKNGEWIYDENPWKVVVSSRSPKAAFDRTYIHNMPPRKKQIILDYIHSKGYELGESEFKMVDADYEPSVNERWAANKSDIINGERLIEVFTKPGISNLYTKRDELNIIYFQDLEDTFKTYPWPFTKPATTRQTKLI